MRGPITKRFAAFAVATAASALVAAAPASAEPDYSTTLNASTTEYKWEGGPASGFVVLTPSEIPCDSPGIHDCDQILIHTEVAGGLTITTAATSPNAPDVDLRLYKSDATGKQGAELATSGNTGSDESVSTNAVAGGYYLAEVDHAINAGGTYEGVAKLKPKDPGAGGGGGTPPSGGGGQPSGDNAPAVGIQRFASKVKSKKLKGFAGNASDDKGVSKVQLALVNVKGKKCKEMKSTKGKFSKANCKAPKFFLTASGTDKWQLKLKKKLKKGSYVLYARAVDTAGQTSAVASQKFKVS